MNNRNYMSVQLTRSGISKSRYMATIRIQNIYFSDSLGREVVFRAVRVADQIIVLDCILSKLLLQKQINVFAHAV